MSAKVSSSFQKYIHDGLEEVEARMQEQQQAVENGAGEGGGEEEEGDAGGYYGEAPMDEDSAAGGWGWVVAKRGGECASVRVGYSM